MLKRYIFACLFVFFLSHHSSVYAQNWYLSGSGGVTILQDADNEFSTLPVVIITTFDTGWNAGGALGYDFGSFRTEFEVAYRENDGDKLKALGLTAPLVGKMSTLSYLFNVFYDYENSSPFTPYIGGGVGASTVSMDNLRSGTTGATFADDDETVFAYKIAVGAAYQVTPMFDLTLDYTYFATSDPEFSNPGGLKFDSEYKSHNFNAGIRFNF